MDRNSIAEKVGRLPFLENMPENARGLVASVIVDVSDVYLYHEGEPLIMAGALSFDTGYVLVGGTVAIETDRDSITLKSPALLGEMAQFRAGDIRNATVRAQGEVVALQFFWDDLYAVAGEEMPEETHTAFRRALDLQLWERFPHKEILSLALFKDLTEDARLNACLPFPALTERHIIKGVDTLFTHGTKCDGSGYLLVSGSAKLLRPQQEEITLDAPNIAGIFPGKSDKAREWSATLMANGEAELLKFSWPKYLGELSKRLTTTQQQSFVESIKRNADKHFWY